MGIDRTALPSKCKNSEANSEYNEVFNKALSNCLKKGLNGESVYKLENGLIRKFKPQFYHHDLRSPKDRNIVEWLALMRHYGAPVRLLDWTYSFYVALFFAIEEAEGDCAVWALNKKYLINRVLGENGEVSDLPDKKKINLLYDRNVERLKTWKSVFAEEPSPFVFPLTPFRLNERLVIQQGDFLCPGDISKPFEENLAAVLRAKVNEGGQIINCIKGLRVLVWVNLYLFEHTSQDFEPQVFLIA